MGVMESFTTATPTNRNVVEAELGALIASWEAGRTTYRLLEAGGGSMTRVPISLKPQVTVVDISPEQLDRNPAEETILGDLHEVDLGENRFDLAVSWDVIEHLRDPWLVIRKLAKSIVPGGILVLAAPNRYSLQGVVTRLTPHMFHVWVYRYLFKYEHAGEPGHAPFPTVLHSDIRPDFLQSRVNELGLEVLYFRAYERSRRAKLKQNARVLGALFDLVARAGSAITRKNMFESDFIIVLRRPS